ncbi:MAG TPA: beta-galactosidase [Gammaproteobacteria bacterium]|nr:beta-galactosidase [Gammaproteobacteria bacterium]
MHHPWLDPEVTALGRLPAYASMRRSEDMMIQLIDGWRFQLKSHASDVPSDWHTKETKDWSEVNLPHLWTMDDRFDEDSPIYTNVVMPFRHEPPELPQKNPTGLYRRTINIPNHWTQDRIVIHIGGVESFFFLYCNGQQVGYAKDSKLPSEFDLTNYLNEGANELALRVLKFSDASYIEDQDHWWHGGVHRHVYLYKTPSVFLQDVFISPDFETLTSSGRLAAKIRIGGRDRSSLAHTIEVQLRSPKGLKLGKPVRKTLKKDQFSYVTGKGPIVELTLPKRKVKPWSAENPTLYQLNVSLINDSGQYLESFDFNVGFRRVEINNRELKVNGATILIRGVNRHDHNPDSGRVLSRAQMREDLLQMKRHNINAVRTSHYPNDDAFYDLCDELGLYVVDEANIEAHHHYARLGDEPVWANQFLTRGQRMVERDKNHPSIIMWSMGNETGFGANHMAMTGWIRQYDPSRPIHNENAICEQGVGRMWDDNVHGTDVICPMYPSVEDIIEHAKHSDDPRPLIMCEFAHAMGNSCGNLKEYWDAIETWHGLQGGFIWEWKDHGIRAEANGIEYWAYGGDFGEERHDLNFVCDGLCWPDGTPHSSLIEYKKVIQPISVTRIGNHYRVTNKHDHIDLSGYSVDWVLLVDGELKQKGRLPSFSTPPGHYEDFTIAVDKVPKHGEKVLRVEFSLKKATSWANRGHIVAWDQFVLNSGPHPRKRKPIVKALNEQAAGQLNSDDLTITFDSSSINSITFAGYNIIAAPPLLNFWRAPIDNDGIKGWSGQDHKALGRWLRYGIDRLQWQHELEFDGQRKLVQRSRGKCQGGLLETISTYELDLNQLIVDHEFTVPLELTDLPRVGVRWQLEPGFEELAWYGLGPHETYEDRKTSGVLQIHQSTVTEQYVPYILPQEHGNLSELRWLSVNDGRTSLKVSGNGRLQGSVSHYSQETLTEAFHTYELSLSPYTWLCLDSMQRGVGGASCGPDTLDKYRVRHGKYRLSYGMEFTS